MQPEHDAYKEAYEAREPLTYDAYEQIAQYLPLASLPPLMRTSRAGLSTAAARSFEQQKRLLCPTRAQCIQSLSDAIDRDDALVAVLICRQRMPRAGGDSGTAEPMINFSERLPLGREGRRLPQKPLDYALSNSKFAVVQALLRCGVPVEQQFLSNALRGTEYRGQQQRRAPTESIAAQTARRSQFIQWLIQWFASTSQYAQIADALLALPQYELMEAILHYSDTVQRLLDSGIDPYSTRVLYWRFDEPVLLIDALRENIRRTIDEYVHPMPPRQPQQVLRELTLKREILRAMEQRDLLQPPELELLAEVDALVASAREP